jgi:hypothetical protein
MQAHYFAAEDSCKKNLLGPYTRFIMHTALDELE